MMRRAAPPPAMPPMAAVVRPESDELEVEEKSDIGKSVVVIVVVGVKTTVCELEVVDVVEESSVVVGKGRGPVLVYVVNVIDVLDLFE